MSGQASLETAVKATRLGALDFVEKPVGLDRLLLTLRNALRLDHLERENRELQRFWLDEVSLIGDAPPMRNLRALIERAAPSDVPILVLGENGTGKELVARAIHELSPRRGQPFVRMNCAAVPRARGERAVRPKGHPGAIAQRRRRFEQADGGTLFLDESATCSPMQALRAAGRRRSRGWVLREIRSTCAHLSHEQGHRTSCRGAHARPTTTSTRSPLHPAPRPRGDARLWLSTLPKRPAGATIEAARLSPAAIAVSAAAFEGQRAS